LRTFASGSADSGPIYQRGFQEEQAVGHTRDSGR
jgi:hypothetical protein